MKHIFGRGPSLLLRLALALLLSVSLMLADIYLPAFQNFRYLLNSAVAPFQYASSLPSVFLNYAFQNIGAHQRVLSENALLQDEVRKLRSNQLLFETTKKENQQLHTLLNSSFLRNERLMLAEVMPVDSDPYSRQVMINKGRTNGVYEGQPVINEFGIVGQVIRVGAHNSRILLLTDLSHSIPVRIFRNDIRAVVRGLGKDNNIVELVDIPSSTDIKQGDKLITSGLGGVFPEGYPVATITSFTFDHSRPFAEVHAQSDVKFDRLRYLLLVWPTPLQVPMTEDNQEEVGAVLSSSDASSNDIDAPHAALDDHHQTTTQ